MSAATPTPPQSCQVILTLAHLLQQHSQSYDDEKNILLDASVKCATKMANQQNHPSQGEGGEVHMVLTGSPRPTFAETNAWLLEGQPAAPTTPGRKTNDNTNNAASTPGILRGSYSICDNNVTAVEASKDASMCDDADNNESGEGDDGPTDGARLLQEYIAECTHNSSTRNANMDDLGGSPTRTGGNVLQSFRERKYSHGDASAGGVTKNNTNNNATNKDDNTDSDDTGYKGPMVGHAVVNAISQAQGAGLHSSRAQLLQGTIDRPDWDQRRWTDGECLFSELIDRCGLDSFEKIGAGSAADAAAGSVRPLSEKTTNLLAHLITVPASTPSQGSTIAAAIGGDEVPSGMEEDVMEEIARGILRCLRRKHSPPASKVYLVLPPMSGGSEERNRERREMASARMSAAWQKLEQYNDMIGAPKLMADAELEFVDASV